MLKRICHFHGYRWPYRSFKAQMRRAAIVAQKLKATKVPMIPKICKSPVESTSQMLLQLQKVSVTTSPTLVSELSSPIAREKLMILLPTTKFPMINEPLKSKLPQLPPLALMLQWQNQQMSAARLRLTLDFKCQEFGERCVIRQVSTDASCWEVDIAAKHLRDGATSYAIGRIALDSVPALALQQLLLKS